MSITNVLVQGLPWISWEQVDLELLLSKYGPVKCSYFWLNKASVKFTNDNDALKAWEAANNNKITIDKRILKLTLVKNNEAPIDVLDNRCLCYIFSYLGIEDKLYVEKVCQRWEKIAPHSWCTTKTLDLTDQKCCPEEHYHKNIIRGGLFAERLILPVFTVKTFSLIEEHCKYLKSIAFPAESVAEIGVKRFKTFGKKNPELEELSLKGIEFFHLTDFIAILPKGMQKINFTVTRNFSWNIGLLPVNWPRFHNLKVLKMKNFVIGENFFSEWSAFKNLKVLGFELCRVHNFNIIKIQYLSKLHTLVIPGCGLTDDLLIKIVKNNSKLESLDISYNRSLTDRSLIEVSRLLNLKNLYIKNLPEVKLKSMRQMANLERLDCHMCAKVKNANLRKIVETSPKLRRLKIYFCPLITTSFLKAADIIVRHRKDKTYLTVITNISRWDLSEYDLVIKIRSPFKRDELAVPPWYHEYRYYESSGLDSDDDTLDTFASLENTSE